MGGGTEAENSVSVQSNVSVQAAGIEINETNFPDKNFRKYLLSGNTIAGETAGADKDGDGVLSPEEITAVTDINCMLMDIADLTGIQYFTELKSLNCSINKLTTLDVSQNKKLESLECMFNQLVTIDVSGNAALTHLGCWDNQLTSLDLSKTSVTDIGEFPSAANKYKVVVDEQGRVDLRNLPEGFDVSKVKNWQGATVDGTILTIADTMIKDGFINVTYTYDCGNGLTAIIFLMVKSIHKHEYCSYKYNSEYHWHECKYADCPYKEGSVTDKDTHDFDDDGTCTVCGYHIDKEEPAEPDEPVTPEEPADTGCDVDGVLSAVAVGVAAGTILYESGTGIYRVINMPGIAMPSNRGELAMLLWEHAGKPEPESAELYSDISEDDTDLNKAARWAVEEGLMQDDADNNKFNPGFPVSKLRTCLTWNAAKEKGLFDKTEE